MLIQIYCPSLCLHPWITIKIQSFHLKSSLFCLCTAPEQHPYSLSGPFHPSKPQWTERKKKFTLFGPKWCLSGSTCGSKQRNLQWAADSKKNSSSFTFPAKTSCLLHSLFSDLACWKYFYQQFWMFTRSILFTIWLITFNSVSALVSIFVSLTIFWAIY